MKTANHISLIPSQTNNIHGYSLPLLLLATFLCIAAGWLLINQSPFTVLVSSIGIGLAIVSFVRPEFGLLILLLGTMLSPEITLAKDVKHNLIIRIEDIFIVIVFVAWMTRTIINKQIKKVMDFPLKGPILTYAVICIVSTSFAIMRGEIPPFRGFFFTLKYIEYFMLFFVAVNVIKKPSDVSMYLWAGLLMCVIVTIYAYYSTFALGLRATTPFEGVGRTEPASLGGYFLIMISLILNFMLYKKNHLLRLLLFLVFLSILTPFVFSLSRASYFASIPMIIYIFYPRKGWKFTLAGVLFLGILIPSIIFTPLGSVIKTRILYTFIAQPDKIDTLRFERSTQARVNNWRKTFTEWLPKHPFIGWGATGVGLVDAQYPRVLGETGIFGFAAFIWILISLWRMAKRNYLEANNNTAKALAIGFLGSFVAILVQSMTTNTFIIIRIMEPFWFLAAIVVQIPKIYPTDTHATA